MTDIKKERTLWLDCMRMIAACVVVLMHTLTGSVDIMNTATYQEGRLMLIVMDLVTWCVPVFLMISGYLFLNPDKKITFRQMLGKYCLRIILAILVFGIPFSFAELLLIERNFRAGMLWDALVMVLTMQSWSHMWYLYLILLLYVLTPGIKHLIERMPRAVLGIIMLVLVVGSSVMPFVNKVLQSDLFPTLPDGMIYLFYYLVGYIMHMTRQGFAVPETEKKISRRSGLIVALLLVAMIVSRSVGGYQLQMAYNYPPTVVLSVAMMIWACNSQMKESRFSKAVTEFSKISFTVYLIHPIFLNVFYKVLNISLTEHSLLLALLGLWLITLVMSIIGATVLHKVKPLRKYVL